MIIEDKKKLLSDIKIEIKAENRENAFLLSGMESDGIICLEDYFSLEPYIEWSSEEKLKVKAEIFITIFRALEAKQQCFVFLHTHPLQKELRFSPLDRQFEITILHLAEQMGYQKPLIFLVASSNQVIGRGYYHNKEIMVELPEEREENKKELLDKVEVLWEESLPKGILYLADSNTVISLSKEAAKLVYQKKQQYLSGKLPNDQLQILERKLEETVGKNAASFLKPATTYEEKRGLKSLEILVQNGCNLNCRYCYADAGTYGKKTTILTPQQGKKLLSVLVEKGIQRITSITFFGGEPSLFPDTIEAICQECEKLVTKGSLEDVPIYYMITNGVSLSELCLQVIKKYKINVTISLDGSKEINDQLRILKNGEGTYEQVLGTIQKMQKQETPPVMIEATYTKFHEENGVSREETIEKLREETKISNIYVCDCAGSYLDPKQETIMERMERDNKEIEKLFVQQRYEEVASGLLSFVILCSRIWNLEEREDYVCNVGFDGITIASDGEIYPCHMFEGEKEFRLGNIFEPDFSLTPNLEAILRLREYTKNERKQCYSCWARNFCSRCVYKMYEWEREKSNFLIEPCEILKNKLRQVLLYLTNMEQVERKMLYEKIKSMEAVKKET